ncbi:MAG: DUF1624 domain-containing protein [Eubacterium sp.]|jgi:Predicted membrane protein|nr:DUF1624 domain-containing protein [Eubacterium sp.]
MRYIILDRIRGVTLLSMIFYHAVWDLVNLYGAGWDWYSGKISYVWQQSICWTFILLSGFCFSLGKRKIRRGLLVFAGGALVSAVTVIAMPDSRIVFGILSFLGAAMLIMVFLQKILQKINVYAGLAITSLLFVITKNVNKGYLGWGKLHFADLPHTLYRNLFTTCLGFVEDGFFSTDFFSLIPWMFLFIAGYYLYGIAERKGLLSKMRGYPEKTAWPVCIIDWTGRHSLIIYLLHQPIIYAVLYIFHLLVT